MLYFSGSLAVIILNIGQTQCPKILLFRRRNPAIPRNRTAPVRFAASGNARDCAELEQHLGEQLFTRNTRNIHLTEFGAAFLPRAQQLLADSENLFSAAKEKDEIRGIVRITVPQWNDSGGKPTRHRHPHRHTGGRFDDYPQNLRYHRQNRRLPRLSRPPRHATKPRRINRPFPRIVAH